MRNALILSLLLHSLFLFILFHVYQDLPRQDFDTIKIQFVSSANEEPVVFPESEKPEVLNIQRESAAENPGQDSPDKVKTENPEVPENVPTGMETKSDESDTMDSRSISDMEIAEQEEMVEADNSGSVPEQMIDDQEEMNLLDIAWQEGRGRRLLKGEEPSLEISRNSILADQVMVEFSVYPDGSVLGIKIVPPGSGDINVDRQLRLWAGNLVFEPDDGNTGIMKGVLTFNLKVRENIP